MDRIPVELLQKILARLDIKSLLNAALVCHAFLDAFTSAERLITTEIFLQQIDYDVLPEAILVNKSWELGTPSLRKGIEFAKNLRHRQPAPTQWCLADALPLAKFHEKVSYLAAEAAGEALKEQPRLSKESPIPTHEEICRFERAIYRFQLYCNVVGRLPVCEVTELQDIFFKYFSPWENEQLACINEHFVRVVALPFNFMVEYDISWGYLEVPPIGGQRSGYAQGIVSRGVVKVYQLSRAEDYLDIRSILSRGGDMNGVPIGIRWFLSFGLDIGANPLIPSQLLSEMGEEVKARVYTKPFYQDPDTGPALMWEWVYRHSMREKLVANPNMIDKRLWGFPFWDFSRLQTAGLLGDPGIPGLSASGDPGTERWRTLEYLKRLNESRNQRREIYMHRGTGLYDPKGESKINWAKYDKIQHRERRVVRPRSLEEAKRFLNACAKHPITRPAATIQDTPTPEVVGHE